VRNLKELVKSMTLAASEAEKKLSVGTDADHPVTANDKSHVVVNKEDCEEHTAKQVAEVGTAE
jgi:hypothetical protein